MFEFLLNLLSEREVIENRPEDGLIFEIFNYGDNFLGRKNEFKANESSNIFYIWDYNCAFDSISECEDFKRTLNSSIICKDTKIYFVKAKQQKEYPKKSTFLGYFEVITYEVIGVGYNIEMIKTDYKYNQCFKFEFSKSSSPIEFTNSDKGFHYPQADIVY